MQRADLALFLGQLNELGDTFGRNRALEEVKRERETARQDRQREMDASMAYRTSQDQATAEHRTVMQGEAKRKADAAAAPKVNAWYQHPDNPKAVIGYSGPAESMETFMANLAKQTGGKPWLQTGNPATKQPTIGTGTMRFPNGSTMITPFFSPEEQARWQQQAQTIPEDQPIYTEVKDTEGNVVWKGARIPGSKNLNPANVDTEKKPDAVRDRLAADKIKDDPDNAATALEVFDRLRRSGEPAKHTPTMGGRAVADAVSMPASLPEAGTTPPKAAEGPRSYDPKQVEREAQNAIARGASIEAVNKRLKERGIPMQFSTSGGGNKETVHD